MTQKKPVKRAGRKPKPPFEVTKPQRYIDRDGYYFHILWTPKVSSIPFSTTCYAAQLDLVPVIAKGAIANLLLNLRQTRDELNEADWLEQGEGK